jgi:hypothetical protein
MHSAHFVLHVASITIMKNLTIFFKAINFVLVLGFGFWVVNFLHFHVFVTTLVLGSQSRQGLAKVRAKSEAWESHFMLSGV